MPTDTATVAVIVPDIANPVFGTFVMAAQALADTDFDPDHEREATVRSSTRTPCTPRGATV
ncbi:hypothetical protein AB0H94_17125 [Streptomyces purpurascens]|uniref:hypothetical protein n=1 Tax=Streptomyces purpurascens TaxID=1924 RepID=UPI0034091854